MASNTDDTQRAIKTTAAVNEPADKVAPVAPNDGGKGVAVPSTEPVPADGGIKPRDLAPGEMLSSAEPLPGGAVLPAVLPAVASPSQPATLRLRSLATRPMPDPIRPGLEFERPTAEALDYVARGWAEVITSHA